jgi:hypothetical protein
MRGTEGKICTEVHMISTYFRLYIESIFDRSLSLYMKEYYISTTTFIASLMVLREICHTLINITTPKQFEPSICWVLICISNIFVSGKLKRNHKSMLNNWDIKTRNSELFISKFKGRRKWHMIYYTIQRPIVQEKLIVYSSLLVAIIKHSIK